MEDNVQAIHWHDEPHLFGFARREFWLIMALAGVQFSHIMDFMVMMPLGPQLMRAFSIAADQFALVVSVYTASAAVSCLLATAIVDRFDRKAVLLFVYAGLVVGTVLCGLAPTFRLLLAARVVTGAFGGLLQAIILAILGDLIVEKRRAKATGLVMAAMSFASVVGVPVGLALAERWGWHSVFLLLGLVSAGNFVLVVKVVPQVRAHLHHALPQGAWHGLVSLLAFPVTWWAILLTTTINAMFAIMPFVSPFLVDIVGVKEAQLAYVYFASGLASLFVTPYMGRLADTMGKRKVFILSSLFSIPFLLLMTHLGHASLLTAIVVYTASTAVGMGRMAPAMALMTSCVETKRRGSFMTLIAFAHQLSASAASYAGGLLIVAVGGLGGFGKLGSVVAIMIAISALVITRIKAAPENDFESVAASSLN